MLLPGIGVNGKRGDRKTMVRGTGNRTEKTGDGYIVD